MEYYPLPGVHYWECVSYARLRIRAVSQPFCVDQLNPAGFNVPNVLIRKTPALFLRGKSRNKYGEGGFANWICRRRHLLPGQPVTLTMTFPLRILLKTKIQKTEASSDNSSSDPETESNAKSEV